MNCGMIMAAPSTSKYRGFEFYSMDIFNRCENTNDVLLAIPGWANVHPLLKVIPVDWDYGIPYGILHSPESNACRSAFSGCG